MSKWQITDYDIEEIERMLLPHGAHFSTDARAVIRCWHSTDISACPGSGKTTVLLAKLKLLADRMPLDNRRGICVLSHTNVAVDEIKNRLSNYTNILLGYPNYIGTIQSFIDKFVTMPYLRSFYGQTVQVVDDFTYAQHMLNRMQNGKYYTLKKFVEANVRNGKFPTTLAFFKDLEMRDDGSLYLKNKKKKLAGDQSCSVKKYKELVVDVFENDGIMRYRDSYLYAQKAIEIFSKAQVNIFSSRFQYVFIDEYQDCDDVQRQLIDMIFDPSKCSVFKIGDPDQAIYNSDECKTQDWNPLPDFLSIATSCRFNQEIANAICQLKRTDKKIITQIGYTGVRPVLLVFSPETIDRVLVEFVSILKTRGLCENNYIKVIGAIKSEGSKGLKISSYWDGFDGSGKNRNEYNYWVLVDEIEQSLADNKLYKTEQFVRRLLCRMFHYANIKNPISCKDYTMTTMKNFLDEKYREFYRQWIYEMSTLQKIDSYSLDCILRQKIKELLTNMDFTRDIFSCIPQCFFNKSTMEKQTNLKGKNVYIDSNSGLKIEFDTIHGVKGETHDVTLYLETERKSSSDLRRILQYFGGGKQENSSIYDYSRKLAYVGMSRPRKLLCVAMQSKTYEKSNGVFDSAWEIIDLRK